MFISLPSISYLTSSWQHPCPNVVFGKSVVVERTHVFSRQMFDQMLEPECELAALPPATALRGKDPLDEGSHILFFAPDIILLPHC